MRGTRYWLTLACGLAGCTNEGVVLERLPGCTGVTCGHVESWPDAAIAASRRKPGSGALDASVAGSGAVADGAAPYGVACALTGYEGDMACLDAPDPSDGFLLHFGPARYDDPVEVAKYVVDPGEEASRCLFRKMPNVVATHAREIRFGMRGSVRRVFVHTRDTATDDSAGPERCAPAKAASTIIAYAAESGTDIVFAGSPAAPERLGAALRIGAREQTMLELRAVNTGDRPVLAEGWVNFLLMPESDVRVEVAPISWLGGVATSVPSGVQEQVQGGLCTSFEDADLSVLRLVADVHAHDVHVAASLQRSAAQSALRVYESFDWVSPFVAEYDSVRANPAPHATSIAAGATSGAFVVHPGDYVFWTCDVNNTTSSALTFSDSLFTGETCSLYGYYAAGLPTSQRFGSCASP